MSARIAATCGAEQSDLRRPFIRLTCESLTFRLEYAVRSSERTGHRSFLHDRCVASSALDLKAAKTPRSRAALLLCRLFEAGLEVIGSLVLQPGGQGNEARSAGSEWPRA